MINLTDLSQLEEIIQLKDDKLYLIFKHSTRCSISTLAFDRIKRGLKQKEFASIPFFYLDLIQYRNISDAISEKFQVEHQSPQILAIRNGICIYNESHISISPKNILPLLEN